MSWTKLVIKNLMRNRRRTLLTVGSVAASLFLVAMLAAGYRFLTSPPSSDNSELILAVAPRASMMMSMPLWYKDRIGAIDGVTAVSSFDYLAAHYGGNNDVIPALALDPDVAIDFFPAWKLPPDELQNFKHERTGLLAGRELADKYGWHVGQRIQLTNTLFAKLSMPFVICGIYDSPNGGDNTVFHWNYLNEAVGLRNRPFMFWVRVRSTQDVQRASHAIDALFKNGPVETRTSTLKQFVLNWLKLLGNVKLVLLTIMAAVVFSVLLIVANTMSMTIRERTTEVAILRAIGFRRRQILELLASEAIVLALAGAVVGGIAAKVTSILISGMAVAGGVPAKLAVDGRTFLLIAVVGTGIALASTVLPAYHVARIRLPEALRFAG